jgi:hypothetical protein
VADTETGLKWWVRYVIVPLIAGGGLVAIIVALLKPADDRPRDGGRSTVDVDKEPRPPLPLSEKSPQTYDFSMSQLDKLAGDDCEMDTDPQDTVRVNFNSQLSHTESEVLLAVSYDAKEYRGNGTKIGKQTRVTTYKAPPGKKIIALEFEGNSHFEISDYGAQSRHHGFRSFGDLIRNSYWNRLEYKVDDNGANDCAVAGVRGTMSFTVVLRGSQ